ncbi:ArsA family ATPase [Aliidiomarina haloalkalitolerans]|uniref:arsenite-transporting ATPase n=1 Tax=Aliidiomarina haloalkalitolerans TaxID=859059 RepID=A0A432VRA2_9GAMM|nr:ArsA family ATPase [Aliidiomarina haloalkalitolerans]RUO18837.1 arsenic-transporting ATPase [Aliidiomarina haloalkalitolerans]
MTWQAFDQPQQQQLFDKRLLLVGGKGGVGKTTISSALALQAAAQGKKVLLISTDPAHNLADVFDCKVGSKARRIKDNLDALEIDPDAEAQAHLERIIAQMKQFVQPSLYAEAERQLRLSANSPGAQEAALLERICREIEHGSAHYDLLIFDTAPTGHTLRLLTLPEAMAAWTQGMLKHDQKSSALSGVLAHLSPKSGRDIDNPLAEPERLASAEMSPRSRGITETLLNRQRLFQRTRRILLDATQTGILYVLIPEKLPILETQRAVATLQDEHLPVAALFVNRVLPATADGEFLAARRAQEQMRLGEIASVFKKLPLYQVPLQATDIQGIEQLTTVFA